MQRLILVTLTLLATLALCTGASAAEPAKAAAHDSAAGSNARDEAAQWRDKGIAALKDLQTHPAAIVAAARAFAKAAECSERAGDSSGVLDADTFLVLVQKDKMTPQDIDGAQRERRERHRREIERRRNALRLH